MESEAKKRLIFVGGGRLAGVLYSTFHHVYDIIGYVDDFYASAYLTTTYGVPSLGTSEELAGLRAEGVGAVVTVTPAAARRKYAELLDSLGFETPSLIFPTAIIDEHARLGKACIVRHQAVISAQAELGRNCMVADNAYVGHDSVIGAYSYVAPGVNVNGGVTVGEGCFLGTGSVILPDLRVGARCMIGGAACVVADVPDDQTMVGVPARPLERDRAREEPASQTES